MSAILLPKKENFLSADQQAGITDGIKRTCSATGLVDLGVLKTSPSKTDLVKELYKKHAADVKGCEWISNHQGKIWNGEKEMKMEINDLDVDMWRVELVSAYDNLFCLHIKTSLEDGAVYILAQHICDEDNVPKFMIRTEFCSPDQLECICNSTKIHPYTEDMEKIKQKKLCAVKPIEVLKRFVDSDGVLRFTAKIHPHTYL